MQYLSNNIKYKTIMQSLGHVLRHGNNEGLSKCGRYAAYN